MPHSATNKIDSERIKQSIEMIKIYIKDENTKPLLSVLEQFNQDTNNESFILELRHTLNKMGSTQGAVLTYAPYLILLLSDDLFADL